MTFKPVDSKMNLPESEARVLNFWESEKIFEKSLQQTKDSTAYHFYDGPPFATGTPHYGHIVQSITKDVIPRYYTMKGNFVERKWGWDCHGLPIENIAEKELGIAHKKDIEDKLGVEKFNETCRSMVLGYVEEWKKVIGRLGRWADMDNAYKTMDLSYMESVWWVFKSLYDKGLIYESYRAMHVCPRCETTLSQSEVSEGYKMTKDLSAIAKFELVDEPSSTEAMDGRPGTFILAWTTTPWTLIGNVALAVGNEIEYVKVKVPMCHSGLDPESQNRVSGDEKILKQVQDDRSDDQYDNGNGLENDGSAQDDSCFYILAKERLALVMKDQPYEVVEEMHGHDLVGKVYRPLFPYYAENANLKNKENGWKVYAADFVTTDEGTGVVHIAPAFGEDDMNLGIKNNLPFVQHVGMDGIIKSEAGEFAGKSVKPIDDHSKTDVDIIKYLAQNGLLFAKEKYEHSYPFCWRCDTPLLNYATTSWFVGVTKIKDEAINLADQINWSPKHIKAGRFGKWLEGARDWSISRQRYWASCMPIWKCDKCGELKVLGSVKELEELSAQTVTDLHKDKLDPITFGCEKCDGTMKRIPDVLDTWFDSGSMPYAQLHYPFENEEKFGESFPADFIGEAQDQTRAWFYYLHVLGTALKDSPAFKNVIVSGMVLAEDGKKMAKKLKNYPDPMYMLDKYGADPLRMYLLNSPILQAESLNFSEKEVAELYRGMFRMLWNSYSFFVLYANIDNWTPDQSTSQTVNQSTNLLDRWILSELNKLIKEVDESVKSYDLTKASRFFAPFIDNLSNWYIRRSRKRFWKSENDGDKNNAYQTLWTVLIELSKLMAPFTPFIADEIYRNLVSCHSSEGWNPASGSESEMTSCKESVHLESYPTVDQSLIDDELNVQMDLARKIVELGLSARAASKIKVRQPLQSLAYHGQKLLPELEDIIAEEVNVKKVFFSEGEAQTVSLDTNITEELKLEGMAREVIRNIQTLRKDSGFNVDDRIVVFWQSDSEELQKVMGDMKDLIAKEVLANDIANNRLESANGQAEYKVEGNSIWIGLQKL